MKILSGKLLRPDRTLIVGTPGIGKSSYGARTRKPIFLEAEVGANELDVARLRRDDGSPLETYAEACAAIDWLTNEPHEYETLVPDTLDWLVHWIEQHVIKDKKTKEGDPYTSIEDFGFGKGYIVVQEELRRFLARLEKLQAKRGMDIVSLAHAAVKKFNPPDNEPYERFDLKMNEKCAALLREWHHNVLFAQMDISVRKGDPKAGTKTKATGEERLLRTVETAAYLAKNRIGLDSTIPFDDQTYSVIQAARKRCLTSDAELATQLESLLVGASDPDATRAWYHSQANKSAAIEALRKRAASAAAKESA